MLLLNHTMWLRFSAFQIIGYFIISSSSHPSWRLVILDIQEEFIQYIIICGRVLFKTQSFDRLLSYFVSLKSWTEMATKHKLH